MKAKDKIPLETVRSIKKVLLEKEVELRGEGKETLTPDDEIAVLLQQAKQRKDAVSYAVLSASHNILAQVENT